MARFPQSGRRGFSVVELLIVVMIIGIIGMIAVPAASHLRAPRLRTAADILAADLEFCQSESIHEPSALRIVRFDVSNNRYWLALAASQATPISHPADSLPYRNDFSTGRNRVLQGVRLVSISGVTCYPWNLAFDAYGKPQLTQSPVITLAADGKQITVTVDATTGDVTVGNVQAAP